jgi:hypothetical protein
MLKRTLQLLIAVCIVTGTSQAADDPFAGKWKLDSSRSQFPADTMKVKSGGANKYTFIFSEPNTETVAIDGIDQPGISGTTLSVTEQGPRVWKVVRKNKARTLLTAIWTLSEDGGTLHDSFTEYRPDGSPFCRLSLSAQGRRFRFRGHMAKYERSICLALRNSDPAVSA